MTAAEFNERVAAAARHQRLRGVARPGSGGIRHKWKVGIDRIEDAAARAFDFGINPLTGKAYFSDWVFAKPGKSAVSRLYALTVGTGCVNDEPACIEYLAKGDPRPWEMPANYPPAVAMQQLFGRDYPFVDRPLWDTPTPVLFLTAPDAAADDLGGFVRTPDQRRPQFFRTAEAWERELYQASVMITLAPYRSDPSGVNLRTGGARTRRWRVTAGKLPAAIADSGVARIASHELARIWLLRTPGKPALDEVHVQQLTYWNLAARSSINLPLLELIGVTAEVAASVDIGLLAFGLTGIATSAALVGIQAAVIDLLLQNLEAIIAATSGVEFWSV